MELYNQVSQTSARILTQRYSTSFGLAAKLLAKPIRPHIYNIYGLVRLADEIVDTYGKADAIQLLDALESEVYLAMKRRYSTNIIVHAFALTAVEFGISKKLIKPFFASMRMDAPGSEYKTNNYEAYIHGSAEVVGLMCLRVFCNKDNAQYAQLEAGATALGSAFQKANFLRDLAEDQLELGRYYFPIGTFEAFNEKIKRRIIADIKQDFAVARPAIRNLPASARVAVQAATGLYEELLQRLESTPAVDIRRRRVRVPNGKKLLIIAKAYTKGSRRG